MTVVPSCSTCGLAVEWLRSCYSSQWRLFSDRPDKLTAGRYYFSEPDAPFYSGPTNLWSANWLDRNWKYGDGLGEKIGAKQKWDGGAKPAQIPGDRPVGSTDCLKNGQDFASGITASSLISGFPPGCFATLPGLSRTFEAASAFQSGSFQLLSAQVIKWSYSFESLEAITFLQGFLGPAWSVGVEPATPIMPAVTHAISSRGTLVWLDGSATFQQLALQAAYGLIEPTEQGGFSTSRFWWEASIYVHSILRTAGALPTAPIFLCGHSYGGAAALILCAIYRLAQPSRTIRFLSFGCPHLGDSRLIEKIRACDGLNLLNQSDFITALPFNGGLLYLLSSTLVDSRFLVWQSWKAPPRRWRLKPDATQEAAPDSLLDWPTLLSFGTDVLLALPYPPILEHSIDSYLSRLYRGFRKPVWPLNASDYARLLGDAIISQEDFFELLQENLSAIAYEP